MKTAKPRLAVAIFLATIFSLAAHAETTDAPAANENPPAEKSNDSEKPSKKSMSQEEEMEISDFMMNYYKEPNLKKFDEMFRKILTVSAAHKGSSQPAIIFISEVFRANPEKIADWEKVAETLPSKEKTLAKIAKNFATEIELGLDDMGPDMLWGAFFATGNNKFPAKVAAIAATISPKNVIDMTAAASAWSLASIAIDQKHTVALEAAKTYLETASPEERAAIAERLSEKNQQILLGEVLKKEEKETPPKTEK